MRERLGIVGSGAIACGLAATAARHGEVVLFARAPDRARKGVDKACGRLSGEVNSEHVRILDEFEGLSDASFVVEAITEDLDVKSEMLDRLGRMRVLVVALLLVAAADRRANGFDDDDLAALLLSHALDVPSKVDG